MQLELEGLGAESTEAALESCRRVLRSSGFLFRDEWARVMKGACSSLCIYVVCLSYIY